jgi:hypothetical protein
LHTLKEPFYSRAFPQTDRHIRAFTWFVVAEEKLVDTFAITALELRSNVIKIIRHGNFFKIS